VASLSDRLALRAACVLQTLTASKINQYQLACRAIGQCSAVQAQKVCRKLKFRAQPLVLVRQQVLLCKHQVWANSDLAHRTFPCDNPHLPIFWMELAAEGELCHAMAAAGVVVEPMRPCVAPGQSLLHD